MKVLSGFIWLRLETSGGLLWTHAWYSDSIKCVDFFRYQLLASQKEILSGHCSSWMSLIFVIRSYLSTFRDTLTVPPVKQCKKITHTNLFEASTTYIRVTLYWEYLIVLWIFLLVCILYCGCFNLFCNVWVCVCVGFVMCGCVYVWVL